MAILVTGAGGFVGQKVVDALLQGGDEVVAADINLDHVAPQSGLTLKAGDLTNSDFRASIYEGEISKVIHLAALPGGAAEQNPELSFKVNVEAAADLMERLGAQGKGRRFVYSSTIAVFGDPMPVDGIDDDTPLTPKLYYGAHKQMSEISLATLTRRGVIDGVGMRLPGIVARPPGPSGMKSAFMSDVFHSIKEGRSIVLPVSKQAQMWLMSVEQVTQNILHAASLDSSKMPENRIATLPAIRASMEEIAESIAAAVGSTTQNVSYEPDEQLEAAFGAQPPLTATNAEKAGFKNDGSLEKLTKTVLKL